VRWTALTLAVVALAACGGGGGGGGGDDRLTIYAASSLTEVFQDLAPENRYNFAGSDELATQLREGGTADVFAAASPKYPEELFADELIERPAVFATNKLVLITPRRNGKALTDVRDLAAGGFKLVIGAEGVPVGDYTRDVLERLELTGVLDEVVSEEENVKGVLGKVALGEADAGFVYATDAAAADDKVVAIDLPPTGQADVRYPAAVVADSDQKDEARAFIELLRSTDGRRALERAGFGLP
jgi:molybdate transport system substrate-binding protein